MCENNISFCHSRRWRRCPFTSTSRGWWGEGRMRLYNFSGDREWDKYTRARRKTHLKRVVLIVMQFDVIVYESVYKCANCVFCGCARISSVYGMHNRRVHNYVNKTQTQDTVCFYVNIFNVQWSPPYTVVLHILYIRNEKKTVFVLRSVLSWSIQNALRKSEGGGAFVHIRGAFVSMILCSYPAANRDIVWKRFNTWVGCSACTPCITLWRVDMHTRGAHKYFLG